MSANDINIIIDHIDSKAPSAVSDEDGLHSAGVHISPEYSEREGPSQSGSSEQHEDYPNLVFPNELPEREDYRARESVSRPVSQRRSAGDKARSSSVRRAPSRRQTAPGREHLAYRYRNPPSNSPPESVDSADEYFREVPRSGPPPRPLYYGHMVAAPPPGYPQSSSSGASYIQYPPLGPPANHVIPYAAQPGMPAGYGQHYPGIPAQPSMGYPAAHPNYPPSVSHHPASHVGSTYAASPYIGTPSMMPYAAPPAGYFPGHYPQPYPQQYMDAWRVQSPPQRTASPAAAAAAAAAPAAPVPVVDQEELVKRVEGMLLKDKEERDKREAAREAEVKAEAKAAADKAERAASDAKIAEEAAVKATNQAWEEAEKKASEEAKKAKEVSELKLKEAEEAVAQAKKEAEEAAKKAEEADKKAAAAAAPPPPEEKKQPIKFHDAIGRKFVFPFFLCAKWSGMEALIRQAFEHVEDIGPHVQNGHYDLMGPDGGIIIPSAWETTIEPDWKITMHMWPMPEKRDDEILPPPLDGDILNLDDLLNPDKKRHEKGKGLSKSSSKKSSSGGGLGGWILGGRPRPRQSLKDNKKPDIAADAQHAARSREISCSVM